MRHRNPKDRRCTYVVPLEDSATWSPGDLRAFSEYLSTLGVAGCDVLILDGSAGETLDRNRRTLRWVGRHLSVRPEHRGAGRAIDPLRCAAAEALCEKVILAAPDVRFTAAELGNVCELLDRHEVVEPQEYVDPLPWWAAIEAGRILVHRSLERHPDHGATFGVRKSSIRRLRSPDWVDSGEDQVRRLMAQGAEVFSALDLFVRRVPPLLSDWLRGRTFQAGNDFGIPLKTALFFALIPMAIMLATFGGLRMLGGFTGAIVFASISLALRGRSGASSVFPMRTAFFAPLWVLERSVSVYWALALKVGSPGREPRHAVVSGGRAPAQSSMVDGRG
jgi:hypothetical protein